MAGTGAPGGGAGKARAAHLYDFQYAPGNVFILSMTANRIRRTGATDSKRVLQAESRRTAMSPGRRRGVRQSGSKWQVKWRISLGSRVIR